MLTLGWTFPESKQWALSKQGRDFQWHYKGGILAKRKFKDWRLCKTNWQVIKWEWWAGGNKILLQRGWELSCIPILQTRHFHYTANQVDRCEFEIRAGTRVSFCEPGHHRKGEIKLFSWGAAKAILVIFNSFLKGFTGSLRLLIVLVKLW